MISIDSQIYMWIMDTGYNLDVDLSFFLLINNKPWLTLDMYSLPIIHIQVVESFEKIKFYFFHSNVVAIMRIEGLKDLKIDYYLA